MSILSEERAWIANLRERGIKAAHPDDGWVRRDRNLVHLEYPQFNDGLRPGDLLALGWPGRTRLVRVTGFEDMMFAMPWQQPWYVAFEPSEA